MPSWLAIHPKARASERIRRGAPVNRAFADVPQDGTWGEAERIFAIMARRVVVAERRAAALEAQVADLQTQLAAALAGGDP
mgnify:CR=1 FL=1